MNEEAVKNRLEKLVEEISSRTYVSYKNTEWAQCLREQMENDNPIEDDENDSPILFAKTEGVPKSIADEVNDFVDELDASYYEER